MADGSGGYENIKVARKFSLPDQDFLQYVHDGIVPGGLLTIIAMFKFVLQNTHKYVTAEKNSLIYRQ